MQGSEAKSLSKRSGCAGGCFEGVPGAFGEELPPKETEDALCQYIQDALDHRVKRMPALIDSIYWETPGLNMHSHSCALKPKFWCVNGQMWAAL